MTSASISESEYVYISKERPHITIGKVCNNPPFLKESAFEKLTQKVDSTGKTHYLDNAVLWVEGWHSINLLPDQAI